MKDNKLEVEDIVYCWHHGYPGYYSRHRIVRLTSQRAVLDNGYQVKNILQLRPFDGTDFIAPGIGSSLDARLANDKLDAEYTEQRIRANARSVYNFINIKEISIEQCKALIELFAGVIKEG